MLAVLNPPRKFAARLFALMALLWVAACDVVPTIPSGANTGQAINPSEPVQVALLVPGGSEQGSDQFLADNLENAARLAVADLEGVEIDLRVYNTGSDPAQAASVATLAVNEGAKIILGPLFADSANAAGVAVASRNVNVLAFSNNATIAGGNVFVLGTTFGNIADRLVSYGTRNGITRIGIIHSEEAGGTLGRDAIQTAIRNNGAQVAGIASYPLSQQGIISSTPSIVSQINAAGADAVFLTATVNADLPILATTLPEAGLNPVDTTYMGLTRWDATPQALALPGLRNGLFTVPDRAVAGNFSSRYFATYGASPHPLAGLAYDGIAAIGALAASGNRDALTKSALTTPQGFRGSSGIFRLLPNGLTEKGLAVATIQDGQVVILENAPQTFGGGS